MRLCVKELRRHIIVVRNYGHAAIGELYAVFLPRKRKVLIKLEGTEKIFTWVLGKLEDLSGKEKLDRLGLYSLGVKEAEVPVYPLQQNHMLPII